MAEERFDRYELLLRRYQESVAARSHIAAAGKWALSYAQEGVAILEADKVVVVSRTFHNLCSGSSQPWLCLTDLKLPAAPALQAVLLRHGWDRLAQAAVAPGPAVQILLFRSQEREPRYLEAVFQILPQSDPPQIAISLRNASDAEDLQRERDDNDRRDEFLAMLAHELRNPLAPIVTSAQLLVRSADPQVHRAAELILRQARHQAQLVAELLDTARVRRGKIALSRRVLDLRDVLREAAQATETERGARVRLHLELPPEPVWVDADPTRMLQCVINLLVNAAKFTVGAGENWLSLEQGASAAWVRVRDTGMGMNPETMKEIFGLFVQGAQSLDRSRGGLGLGLALTKALIEMHDGGVRVHSEGEGQGAEFTLWLPLSECPAEPPPAPVPEAAAPLPGRRVLLVEDIEDVRESLAEYLTEEGYTVLLAATGPAGVAEALRERPDVVLCDIGLPGMDGFAVARRLRSELPGTRLVALSGYSREEEQARAREVGFDAYLVKPVDLERLIYELQAVRPSGA